MSDKIKIPSKITIGGQEIEIKPKERIEGEALGRIILATGVIEIAETFDCKKQSSSSKINTFYHELTHAILDTMGEKELSANEKFVSCFSSFLTDAMVNAYFKE